MALPVRKNMRLLRYDYAANGAYFITLCTKGKQKLLRDIVRAGLCARPQIRLTMLGKQVQDAIGYMSRKYPGVSVDAYVIMPNHIHFIFTINRETGGHGDPPLHQIIGEFKSYTAHLYGGSLWHRSFYDHVIRGEEDYLSIAEYIENNPAKWLEDRFYL